MASEPLDHELVMIAGEGKKHGKEAIAGDMFPRSSTRTLAEHKARLGLPKSFVCERATPCLLVEKFIVERRLAAAERAEERRLATEDWAAERTEERRLVDERTQQAYCIQNASIDPRIE